MKLGLIRYLAWIVIGAPPDIPGFLAQVGSMAAACEALFNKGVGTPEQRLRAALWISEIDLPEGPPGRPSIQAMLIDEKTS